MMSLSLWLTLSASAAPLELGDDVRFAEAVALEQGHSTWVLDDDSFVFPIRQDETLVGWIGVGAGEQEFVFEAKWQAERFANTWVAGEGLAPADVASAVRDGSWTEPFDVVMALSGDRELWGPIPDLKRVVIDRSAVGYVDDNGVFNVVVSPLSLASARRLARRALTDRVHELARGGLDVHDALAIDHVDPGPDRWLVDVRTERSWRVFVEPAADNLQGRWLSTVHDPYGWVDDALHTQVFVVGRGADEVPKRALIAGAPGTSQGAVVSSHQANVRVSQEAGGRSLAVAVDQAVTLTASGPTATVALAQPYRASSDFHGGVPMPQAYEGLRVETTDGQALTRVADAFGALPEPGVDAGVWQLPTPLEAGESVSLRLHHIDRWRTRHTLEVKPWVIRTLECKGKEPCNDENCVGLCPQLPEFTELGRVSAAEPVVARAIGQVAHPVEVRVGTTLPGTWNVAITGGRTERSAVGDGRWWVAQSDSRARITVAQDRGSSAHPSMGLPGIEIIGHGQAQSGTAPFLRSVLHFYNDTFPDLPVAELDLVRAADRPAIADPSRPSQVSMPEVEAYPGQVVLHSLTEFLKPHNLVIVNSVFDLRPAPGSIESRLDKHAPHHIEREIAGAVGAQWFLERDVAQRDAWLVQAAAGYLRSRFTAEAYGPDEADTWDALQRKAMAADIQGTPAVPLDRAEPWTATVGTAWLSALEARIGERGVNRALVSVLQTEGRTTDDLAAALAVSGSSNRSHWVDFWVRGGVRPTVRAVWSQDDTGQLTVDVSADTPFGRFDVPLSVDDRKGSRTVWVEVIDGAGSVTVDLRRPVERVAVDPDGRLPIRRTEVHDNDPVTVRAQGAPRVSWAEGSSENVGPHL